MEYQVLFTSKRIIRQTRKLLAKTMAFRFGTVTNKEILKITKEAVPNYTYM